MNEQNHIVATHRADVDVWDISFSGELIRHLTGGDTAAIKVECDASGNPVFSVLRRQDMWLS